MSETRELEERIAWATEMPGGFTLDGKPAYLMQLAEAKALAAELSALRARAEAAERRLLPPALTEAQRGILAQAMCDANTGGGFWPHFDEQSRNPWFGITDRFHTLLSRIEKEGE
jgi:hypothetical protein